MVNYSFGPPPCERARGQKTGPVGDPLEVSFGINLLVGFLLVMPAEPAGYAGAKSIQSLIPTRPSYSQKISHTTRCKNFAFNFIWMGCRRWLL